MIEEIFKIVIFYSFLLFRFWIGVVILDMKYLLIGVVLLEFLLKDGFLFRKVIVIVF